MPYSRHNIVFSTSIFSGISLLPNECFPSLLIQIKIYQRVYVPPEKPRPKTSQNALLPFLSLLSHRYQPLLEISQFLFNPGQKKWWSRPPSGENEGKIKEEMGEEFEGNELGAVLPFSINSCNSLTTAKALNVNRFQL